MATPLKSACGLTCNQCPAFIARETNDNNLRAQTAKEWNIRYQANFKPEEVNCVGCLQEGIHSGYCPICPIRSCVITKHLTNCAECSDFAVCQARMDFEQHSGLNIKELNSVTA